MPSKIRVQAYIDSDRGGNGKWHGSVSFELNKPNAVPLMRTGADYGTFIEAEDAMRQKIKRQQTATPAPPWQRAQKERALVWRAGLAFCLACWGAFVWWLV